jgi:hypothetical protein
MEARRATTCRRQGFVNDSRPRRSVPKKSYEALRLYLISSALVRMVSSKSLRSLVITIGGIGARVTQHGTRCNPQFR